MKAAVCCPGPSLPKTWPGDYDYAAVWAVNRALLHIPRVDYLSAGDMILFNKLLGDARPGLGVVTMDDNIPQVREIAGWNHLTFTGWKELRLMPLHKERGHAIAWSVQIALIHAFELGATHIDLFGADGKHSTQVEDCTGYAGEDRTSERWKREERDLALTIWLLAERDVTVNRVLL